MNFSKIAAFLLSLIAAALVAACGGGGASSPPPTLQSIAVTPANPSLPAGMTRQFTATGAYSNGASQDITASVTWSSGTATVATIAAGGLATGVGLGSSTITATSGSITGSTPLTVTTAILVNAVTWSGTQFVSVGWDGIVGTSPDGITWASDTTPISNILTSATLNSVVWSGTQFVAVGVDGGSTICLQGDVCTDSLGPNYSVVLTSPDGHTWTSPLKSALSEVVGSGLNGVAWSGTQFVAVGEYTREICPTLPQCTAEIFSVILTSPDGLNWTSPLSSALSTVVNSALNAVTWSGTQFVAVGANGTVLTSPDGITWTPQTSPSSNTFNGIVWSGTQFAAMGLNGGGITSPNGVTWASQASGTGQSLNGIVWSGTQFVAVGGNGVIVTSPNGVTWAQQVSGTSQALSGIAWSGTQFVAGGGGTILTSPDGITWTRRTAQ